MNLARIIRSGLLPLAGAILLITGGLWLSAGTAGAEPIPKQLLVPTDPEGNKSCHNGSIPEGGSLKPGSTVHHPMKEMLTGYGAVDRQHAGRPLQAGVHQLPYDRGQPSDEGAAA